jgi:putative ABC transport system substrate-binding protein
VRGLRLARSSIIAIALLALLSPVAALAQQAAKVARIGYLGDTPAAGTHLRAALLQGLRDLGYVEGRNVVIEYRFAEGKAERLPALAAELVALNVDVIVAGGGTPGALAAKRASSVLPIVFLGVGDPVASGLVTSLARPGGNVTGLTNGTVDLIGKCLSKITSARAAGLTVLTSRMFFSERRRLVDVVARNRLPAVYGLREFVDGGAS